MTTVYKTANTPDGGRVVRRLHHGWVGAEAAWREYGDGRFACSIGHKGLWITCQWAEIPEPVRQRFRAA